MVTTLFGGGDPPEYYTDSVRIAANLYSFVLEFGVQGVPDTAASEAPQIQRVATLRMSPHHALAFHKLLTDRLARYEKDVGPINIPENFLPKPPEGE